MRRLLPLMVLANSRQINGGDSHELWGIVKMWPYPVPLTNSSIPSYFYNNWPHFSSLLFNGGKNGLGFCPGEVYCVLYLFCAYSVYTKCVYISAEKQPLFAKLSSQLMLADPPSLVKYAGPVANDG